MAARAAKSGIDSVLASVLKKVTPSDKEKRQTLEMTKEVEAAVTSVIKPLGLEYTLAGSFIRDTWMMDKREFDVFVMFPEATSREELEKKGLDVGKRIVAALRGRHEIAYAEHPYVRARVGRYCIDIVPCYKLPSAEKIKSAVDRTPFHNEWLREHFSPSLSGETRLLKQFCKANHLYGSDTRTLGFSGYLCELLTVKHESFRNLVKEAADWWPGEVFMDPGGHYPGSEDLAKKKFSGHPLIMIDPVDRNRNVAAVVSPANFMKFVRLARRFSSSPSEALFFKRAARPKVSAINAQLKKRGTKMLAVVVKRPRGLIDDTLWPQLRKTTRRLVDILREYEFLVMGWDSFADDSSCIILIEMEVWGLPNIRKIKGPNVLSSKHSEEFIKKYSQLKPPARIWVEDDYWVAEQRRAFRSAGEKLKDSLSDPLKDLKAKGIASNIAESIARGFNILEDRQIVAQCRNAQFCEFMENYLGRNLV